MKGIYLFLADGFEETEAIATLDVLRRGKVAVETVSMNEDPFVTGAHGVPFIADRLFMEMTAEKATPADVMIFPGGLPGASNLAGNKELVNLMKAHYADGGIVAAICAAPGLVVSQLDGLQGVRFTCYEGFQEALEKQGAVYERVPAVTYGNLVTGRGPGYAIDFGLAILTALKGADTAAAVREGMFV